MCKIRTFDLMLQELVKQNKELKISVEAEKTKNADLNEEIQLITKSLENKQWESILEINKDLDRVSGLCFMKIVTLTYSVKIQ